MPYPQPFVRVVASGTMFNEAEIWSTSWSLADPNTGNDAEQPDPDLYASPVLDWFTRASSFISNECRLDRIKVNLVGTDGAYSSASETFEAEIPQAVAGFSNARPIPQASVVVTLMTDRVRGAGSKGRFYPPMNATMGLNGNGQIGEADALAMADSAAQLVLDMNTASGLGSVLQVVVASPVGAGRFTPVTQTRVGRVVDTQRRRRSALNEGYVLSGLLKPPAQG